MNLLHSFRSFAFLFVGCSLLISCTESSKKMPVVNEAVVETVPAGPPKFNFSSDSTAKLMVKTFEVKDSVSGKSLGWGYDIYLSSSEGDQLTIHQPTIPAIQGIQHFSSQADALKTGEFAMNKMKESGSLPTLSIEELRNLGVTK